MRANTWCSLTHNNKITAGVLQCRELFFLGPRRKFSLTIIFQVISDRVAAHWNCVYIKYKKYNHNPDASTGLFIKQMKNYPQNSRLKKFPRPNPKFSRDKNK